RPGLSYSTLRTAAWHSSCSPIAAKSVGPSTATCPWPATSSCPGTTAPCSRIPDGGVWLQDTSMNGTLVNGRRILGDVAELRQDDVITVCPLPRNSTVAFRLKLLGHEQPDEASESGSAEPPQTMDLINRQQMLAADPSTVSKVPTVSADAAAASASASASSSRFQRSNGSQSELHNLLRNISRLRHPDTLSARLLCRLLQPVQRTNPVCPQCRVRPERVTKNVLVTNLAEAYLAAHPERRRQLRSWRTDEDESDEEDEDSDDDGNAGVAYFGMNRCSGSQGRTRPISCIALATPLHLRHVCRQCPGYSRPTRRQPLAPLRAAGAGPPPVDGCPHLDDLRWEPLQVAHVCPDNQAHLLCQCCWQAFPDRRPTRPARPRIADSSAALCQRFFPATLTGLPPARLPSAAWPNSRISHSARRVLEDVVNGNPVESKISPTTSSPTIWAFATCSESAAPRLAAGEYRCSRPVRPDTPVWLRLRPGLPPRTGLAYRSACPPPPCCRGGQPAQ
uniref:RING-type E3 ubiquitin transferase n=1 Tax=Macrostomum lignano TaxID=282301 RepID=A0A1I8IZ48_9PLAT